MPNRIDMTGHRFNLLMVLKQAPHVGQQTRWLCRCDCGALVTVRSNNLRSGNTGSCGCRERFTHGHSRSRTYQSWAAMIQRCTNPRNLNWRHYGGRGIAICQRWRESFASFLADMGERPRGGTLDRRNTNGNYEPENCRWSSRSEQQANKRPYHLSAATKAKLSAAHKSRRPLPRDKRTGRWTRSVH